MTAKGKKEITPIEYAEYKKCVPTYIHRLVQRKDFKRLPYVISIRKYSRFYLLLVPNWLGENEFIEWFADGTKKIHKSRKKTKFFNHGRYYKY